MSLFNAEKLNKRNTSLDIVRIVALFCVIGVHFFLNSGFYDEIITGKLFYLMVSVRTAFMVCVPLFIMLTGFLMNKKELNKKYYKGIVKTIGIYVLASIVCLIFKATYLGYNITIKNSIFSILNFKACDYSWYVEMYIGLFMLTPFLNLVYNNLKNKKEKTWLVLTMLILTSVPTIVNIFNFEIDGWFLNPTISKDYNQILPFWWQMLYPLTYYFIGAFICEFRPKINKMLNALLLFGSIAIFGAFIYYRSYGSTFATGIYESWGSMFNIVTTTLLFMFLYDINCQNVSIVIKGILKYISDISLGGYLLSVIVDRIVYEKFNSLGLLMSEKFKYIVAIVPIVFVSTLIISGIVNAIYNLISRIVEKIYNLRKV